MLDYTKKKWQDIKKVKDLLSFLEDPKADVMELMKTLVDPAKSGFWIAANVDFNLDIDKIINVKKDLELKLLKNNMIQLKIVKDNFKDMCADISNFLFSSCQCIFFF